MEGKGKGSGEEGERRGQGKLREEREEGGRISGRFCYGLNGR